MIFNWFKNKISQESLDNNNLRGIVIRELFYFFSFLLFITFILESIFPNIIIAYFNLNILVLFWFIIALATLNDK